MNIFNTIRGIVLAITLAFMNLTGPKATEVLPQLQIMASTTNAAIIQSIQEASTTQTSYTVSQAYELGKVMGALQDKLESVTATTTTMNETQTPVTASGGVPPEPTAQPTQDTDQTQPDVSVSPAVQAPASQADLEIISPIPALGIGPRLAPDGSITGYRVSSTYPAIDDDTNYIVIAAVVYADDGHPMDDATVNFTATDSTQDKTINGTGVEGKIMLNGVKVSGPIYEVTYNFNQPGEHTLTFSSNGMEKSVTINVE